MIPFFSYPPEVRKIIYTTNAIESLQMQLRKIIKNHTTSAPPISAARWVEQFHGLALEHSLPRAIVRSKILSETAVSSRRSILEWLSFSYDITQDQRTTPGRISFSAAKRPLAGRLQRNRRAV